MPERMLARLGFAVFAAGILFLSLRLARLERLAENLGLMHTHLHD